jgi:hypothetical protein
MRWLAWIAIGAMHAACSSNSSTPDAQMSDAAISGLVLDFVAKNGVPQTLEGDVVVERVVLGITMLRAIGDAAPGDLRTTRTEDKLGDFDWRDGLSPIPHLFEEAPPGMYSTVELRIAKSMRADAAVDIFGRVPRAGNLVPFEIKAVAPNVSISVDVNKVLPPRGLETITIQLDVESLVEDIDWSAVPLTGDGRLFVGDGDPEMSKMTSQITGAFKESRP